MGATKDWQIRLEQEQEEAMRALPAAVNDAVAQLSDVKEWAQSIHAQVEHLPHQVQVSLEQLSELESRLRGLNQRLDKEFSTVEKYKGYLVSGIIGFVIGLAASLLGKFLG